jgi:alpha-galactosidase
MEAVADRHPEQTLMLCASGGGRADLGSLRWFHEIWLSDNTDPLDRLRMQWAASYFLPANVVAAHVTREGDRPLAFGCAVAMSARFGFDLDLADLTDGERSVCRQAVALYRVIRPVIQQGDLWRLTLTDEQAALAYLSTDALRAVIFAFQLTERTSEPGPLCLGGLQPDRTYRMTAVDLAGGPEGAGHDSEPRLGADLADRGIAWPLTKACTACIWVLDAE